MERNKPTLTEVPGDLRGLRLAVRPESFVLVGGCVGILVLGFKEGNLGMYSGMGC